MLPWRKRQAARTPYTTTLNLRGLLDSAAAGIVVQDDSGRIVECNPEAERVLGLPREQLLGRYSIAPCRDAIGPDGSALADDDHPANVTLRTGAAVRDQLMGVRWPDGTCRWLQITSQRLDGSARRMVVTSFVDVTAREAMQSALAQERMRLEAALEGTHAAVWMWDLSTDGMHLDRRWGAIMGLGADEVLPDTRQRWLDIVHPDDVPRIDRELRQHFKGRIDACDVEVRQRHRDGHWVWVRINGRVASWSRVGRPLRMFGTLVDITARKLAEQATQRAHEQLRGLFAMSPLGIGLRDVGTGRFIEVNDALVSISGYSREALLRLDEQSLTAPAFRTEERRQHATMLRTGRYGPYEKDLLCRDGSCLQVIDSGICLPQDDGRVLAWTIVQDISPRKALERELRSAARTDRLTGLPNRALLMERLEHAVDGVRNDRRRHFALLFLDFDRFKLVNDTLGHDAGDELLRQIAGRLCSALRASDLVGADPDSNLIARFGGDEFVVLLNDVDRPDEAGTVAQRLLQVFAAPYQLRDKDIHSSVSIGIVMGGADSEGAEGLLRNADTAMYEAKRAGRGRAVFYDEGMHVRLTRSLTLEAELRQAVARRQLSVVYQPIVDLGSGRIASAEALLRWSHPELGQVSPAEFIPVAEESGLIVPIGEWVLRQACEQWSQWQNEDPMAAPDTLSVNLSRVQMNLPDRLVQVVAEVLRDTGMAPDRLQLEVTEREVMHEPAAMRALMQRLHALGVCLAMDDFGTGTSSLGCLRDYPFDVVKIDKSFLADLQSSPDVLAVLHATVTVIENLGMTSVAEGVEQQAQVVLLQSIGCRFAQGYLFARPVAADQWLPLVQARAAASSTLAA